MSAFEVAIKIIPIVISLAALAFSIGSHIFRSSKEKKTNSPFLIVDKIELTDEREGGLKFYPSVPLTDGPEIILDSRSFLDSNGEKEVITDSIYSLILDSRKSTNNRDNPLGQWAHLAIVTFRNIGYDLISFEIVKANIDFASVGEKSLELKTSKHTKLFHYLSSGDAIDVSLSYVFDFDQYALIKKEALDENLQLKLEVIEKLIPIKGNILNVFAPIIIDAYEKITLEIVATNNLGVQYNQTIEFTAQNNHYSVESRHK